MAFSFPHPDDSITPIAPLQALGAILRPSQIEEILLRCKRVEKRRRRLPAHLVLALLIAMAFYSHNDIRQSLADLIDQWPMAGGAKKRSRRGGARPLPAKGAISNARRRLGVRPMRELFAAVAGPIATLQTPGAFLFGLRLMALDGSVFSMPDTACNAEIFGRSHGGRGEGADPLLRAAMLIEAGTHVLCDVQAGPFHRSESALARRLIQRGSIKPGMLVMWDRGLYGYAMVGGVLGKGADFLCRIQKQVQPKVLRQLDDGTQIVRIYPNKHDHGRSRRRDENGIDLRMIQYRIDDPALPGAGQVHRLLTSLLDPEKYPAKELSCEYHQRWEIENTFDEIKTHELASLRPTALRSLTPRNVMQEFYGLLLAHLAIRTLIHEAARQDHIDPDRISFTQSLRVIRRHIPKFQASRASPLLF